MRPTKVTVSSQTSSAWIPVDWTKMDFNLGIMVDVSAGATLTWGVQITTDDIFDSSVTPTAVSAPSSSGLDTGTGDEIGNITIPCTAVRLNVSAHTSGSAVMTVVQGRG